MQLSLESVDCVWNASPHNAFTDLIHYQNEWYCGFREGSSHMSLDGRARILKSSDGVRWSEFELLSWQGGDVRDPKFTIMPDGALLITVGVRLAAPSLLAENVFSTSWLLASTGELSGPLLCQSSVGTWRWGAALSQDQVFSVGYFGKDLEGCLYRSNDGGSWQAHVRPFFPDSPCFANESSLVFSKSGTAFCLLRRDRPNCSGLWGVSKPPFTRWNWFDLPFSAGGPKLLELSSGQLVACFRSIQKNSEDEYEATTVLYEISSVGEVRFLIQLPSGGDTSYAGLVEHNQQLWVSYYSSHEAVSSIYLAKLQIILSA